MIMVVGQGGEQPPHKYFCGAATLSDELWKFQRQEPDNPLVLALRVVCQVESLLGGNFYLAQLIG